MLTDVLALVFATLCKAAMELELDPSSLGQSFEKVGDYHSEKDMEKLRAVGPLGQVEVPVAEPWLADDVAKPKPGLEKKLAYSTGVAMLPWNETAS